MPDGYLDLDPDVVAAAGGATAGTSGEWSGWAADVATLLRGAAGGAQESEVTSALEGYLSTWNPRLQGFAVDVEAMGTNAASASHAVANADSDSAGQLGTVGSLEYGSCPALSRPITAG